MLIWLSSLDGLSHGNGDNGEDGGGGELIRCTLLC